MLKRWLGPLLGLLLLAGVALGVRRSWTERAAHGSGRRVALRIVTGSEKVPLLKDERLLRVLERHGVTIQVQKAGSREIATLPDLQSYDVAFPAGQAAAEKIRRTTGAKTSATAFSTPMVIASWIPIAEILARDGIVHQEGGTYWVADMGKLLGLMAEGKRWRDLPGNSSFAVGKSVLVSTTNVSTSNSAAQFLALASYLLNGAEVVATPDAADAAARKVAPLFSKQGYQESSSAGPFEDYVSIGMGKTPLVWIYEAQFLEQAFQRTLKPGMIVLYPRPTLFTKHVMLPLSDKGARFVEAMSDPDALAVAAQYGYRTERFDAMRAEAKAKALVLPDLVDLVDPPSYEMLERMIVAVENGKETTP